MIISKLKDKVKNFVGKAKYESKAETLFNDVSLPVIGVCKRRIVYISKQLNDLIPDIHNVLDVDVFQAVEESVFKVVNTHYLIKKIAHGKVEYYLILNTKTLNHTTPFPQVTVNAEGKIIWCDEFFKKIIGGYVKGSLNLLNLVDEGNKEELQQILTGIEVDEVKSIEVRLIRDEIFYLMTVVRSCHNQYQCYFVNVMQYKNLEMNFIHSQKMQAIGHLAAGISHDFNNLLTAILGFCDLLLLRHSVGDPSFTEIMQIKQNSIRAANLVKQLLTISRKQMLTPKILDIAEMVSNLTSLLRRLISENIELKINYEKNLNRVKMDPSQFEQVLMNLVVNARDAIIGADREKGMISISFKNCAIESLKDIDVSLISPMPHEQILPGDYVLIEVVDNGTGISKKIIKNIFEPFFSTKALGSGTGLGLSMVYGIVKQANGYLYIDSEEGKWTKFCIYFKAIQEEKIDNIIKEEEENKSEKKDLTGNVMVLFVEDENPVRVFGSCALSNKGYKVLEAENGEDALKIIRDRGKEIDLIVTDTIMPGISGPSLIMEVQKVYPDIKVLFISGYSEENISPQKQPINFLAKPFTLNALITKVKEVLEQ
ncbi:MAG: response regulator [Rickettsiales bacterium]|nr:response regulator [Rickettsiales bacterium]